MRIQHNIMAMNSYRNYTSNNSQLSKNLEKLSSGYKINRAGDDAAGLAISEKMRAQITGLQTAQSNAQSGINLVQTAEGALTEVHDMLNRMVELADQSANGTYDNDTDRANLQKEFSQLSSEIDRIADASNFNGQSLLDGKLAKSSQAATNPGLNFTAASATKSADDTLTYNGSKWVDGSGQEVTDLTGYGIGAFTTSDALAKGDKIVYTAAKAATATSSNASVTATGTYTGTQDTKLTYKAANWTTGGTGVAGWYTDAQIEGDTADTPTVADVGGTYNGVTIGGTPSANDTVTFTATKNATATFTQKSTTVTTGGLTLQIGDTSDSFNKITVGIDDMHVDKLGSYNNDGTVKQAKVAGATVDATIENMSIAKQEDAAVAVDVIKNAINQVSATRGELGATQNRLEHTINNLSVMTENIQDAESNIRDVDVAAEMMEYTKNNILVQSAQAMLAQANQAPQGVLQLLQ